ncbi:MAG: FAD-dependent monooxygenase [Myxococcaceae bacterium]|nr:FAD-dependent monooxygenase [Myxococcaceae bacterium]
MNSETTHPVVIAGAGPTGLMLAAELKLSGVEVVVVERRATQDVDGSRAGGLHARTIEVLDQRGIAGRFLAEGKAMQVAGFAGTPLDVSDFPTRHGYGLALWQRHIERLLAEWAAELQVGMLRACEVTGFAQDDAGVSVALSDGRSLRAQYLVGCDGGRSVVRKAAGIAFDGFEPTVSHVIAEVEFAQEPPWGMQNDARGQRGFAKLDDGRHVRVMVTEAQVGATAPPTLEDLRALLVSLYGSDFGVHSPVWISRFTDAARQATRYREGRVLLAGDAAHVHYPVGGQGLNLGVQDAVNLGWKLGQVVKGTSSAALLDTYHSERHPVAVRVLRDTLAQVALNRTDERSKAVRELFGELLQLEEPRKRYAGKMSGLELRYPLGDGHPLVGRRMPDLDLDVGGRATRLFTLLHRARPLLLDLKGPGHFDLSPWGKRVDRVLATAPGRWELPVVGMVAAPAAVLVRPDGYVAWAGTLGDEHLPAALTTWFGAPDGR